MSVIDKLVSAGRDPLEAILIPPADDVAQWLEDEKNEKLDKAIVAELRSWSPEMYDRLLILVERHLTQRAPDLSKAAEISQPSTDQSVVSEPA